MTIRSILEYPHPRLREQALPVGEFDAGFRLLADDLADTLAAGTGIGLSAPQIDGNLRVLAMDLSEREQAPEIYANPEILSKSAWGLVEESCLSVPGIVGNVWRATKVRARARGRDGELFERTLTGMHAVCLQHEIDHLDGKLFIDRLSIFRRMRLRGELARRAA